MVFIFYPFSALGWVGRRIICQNMLDPKLQLNCTTLLVFDPTFIISRLLPHNFGATLAKAVIHYTSVKMG